MLVVCCIIHTRVNDLSSETRRALYIYIYFESERGGVGGANAFILWWRSVRACYFNGTHVGWSRGKINSVQPLFNSVRWHISSCAPLFVNNSPPRTLLLIDSLMPRDGLFQAQMELGFSDAYTNVCRPENSSGSSAPRFIFACSIKG